MKDSKKDGSMLLNQQQARKGPCIASQSPLFGVESKRASNSPSFGCRWNPTLRRPNAVVHNLLQQSLPFPTVAAATAVTSTTATSTSVGFWKVLFAFCLGGLFFSTALAAVSACYAVGLQNVKTLWDIVRAILVAVWKSFVAALQAAKAALLLRPSSSSSSTTTKERQSWQWRTAWQVLQQELGKTRQTAAQGISALRQEAALYAGAVGAPGLIPLQYLLDRFLPYLIANTMETSLQEALAEIPRQTRSIQKIKLTSFSIGTQSPQLQAARVYELGPHAVAYDIDVDWPADALEIKLQVVTAGYLARIPVVVRNVQFQGVIRLVLTPLLAQPPGFGAALVSFPKAPRINLNVRVAGGDITRIPWLRSELVAAIQKGIADELLWPKRVVVPSTTPVWSGGTRVKEKTLLSAATLQALERTDPLLEREQALAESPLLRDQYQAPQLSTVRQQFKVFVNRKTKNNNANGDTGDTSNSHKGDPGNGKHDETLEASVASASITLLSSSSSQPTQRKHAANLEPTTKTRLNKIQRGVLLNSWLFSSKQER